jgi:pyruvate ferredoxin oxidoreductase alpha subunit/oxalate oxidoreductase subunit alpha
MSGVVAVAHAVRLADVDVIASYPIRPYTGVMSELARMIADGELDAELVYAEGEHAQLSIAYGAAASGARTFVGSSGVGVTYAMEVYSPTSGERLPVQCMIADRTLDPPGDFGSEHTDALCARDQAWIMGWAETPQEALDMSLLFYRVGEDQRVSLPQFPCQDGYFVSHILGHVEVPEKPQVDEFLPPFKPVHYLDPGNPMILGAQIEPSMSAPLQYQRHQAMKAAQSVIREATDDFNRIFGRNYSPMVEFVGCDDADVVFVIQGAHTWTARTVVKRLRDQGYKVGLAKIRVLRPFPTEELREGLSGAKVVGVVDVDAAFGISSGGGVLLTEVRSALYGLSDRVRVIGFVAGLGGEVITREEFYSMARKMLEVAAAGKVTQDAFWLPFEL